MEPEHQKVENEDKLTERDILMNIYKYLISIDGQLNDIKGQLDLINSNIREKKQSK